MNIYIAVMIMSLNNGAFKIEVGSYSTDQLCQQALAQIYKKAPDGNHLLVADCIAGTLDTIKE